MPSQLPPRAAACTSFGGELMRGFLVGALASPLLAAAVAALYLAKSALGIDLMPGPSPLHGLLFDLLR